MVYFEFYKVSKRPTKAKIALAQQNHPSHRAKPSELPTTLDEMSRLLKVHEWIDGVAND
jgi:hypothetical protein